MADLGKQGTSKPGGGTVPTAPTRDHGVPHPQPSAAPGAFGPKDPHVTDGAGNNDKHKPK